MGNTQSGNNIREAVREFYRASRKGDVAEGKKILERFPDQMNHFAMSYFNPLETAAMEGHAEFVQLILDTCPPVNLMKGSAVKEALFYKNFDIASAILDSIHNGNSMFSRENFHTSPAQLVFHGKNHPHKEKMFLKMMAHGGFIDTWDLLAALQAGNQDACIMVRLLDDICHYEENFARSSCNGNERLFQLINMPPEELRQSPEAKAVMEKYPELLQIIAKRNVSSNLTGVTADAALFSPKKSSASMGPVRDDEIEIPTLTG